MVAICGPLCIASDTTAVCAGCDYTFEQTIAKFYQQDDTAIDFLQNQGVLPKTIICKTCGKECAYDKTRYRFQCYRQKLTQKTKEKKCKFTLSLLKDTWLEKAKIKPSENLRF